MKVSPRDISFVGHVYIYGAVVATHDADLNRGMRLVTHTDQVVSELVLSYTLSGRVEGLNVIKLGRPDMPDVLLITLRGAKVQLMESSFHVQRGLGKHNSSCASQVGLP